MRNKIGMIIGLIICLLAVLGYFYLPIIFGDMKWSWIFFFLVGLIILIISFNKSKNKII